MPNSLEENRVPCTNQCDLYEGPRQGSSSALSQGWCQLDSWGVKSLRSWLDLCLGFPVHVATSLPSYCIFTTILQTWQKLVELTWPCPVIVENPQERQEERGQNRKGDMTFGWRDNFCLLNFYSLVVANKYFTFVKGWNFWKSHRRGSSLRRTGDIWSVERDCGCGDSGFIRLKWVLISISKVMEAAPCRGFVPFELCSEFIYFSTGFHLPYFMRFLVRKGIFFRTTVSTGWGSRRRHAACHVDIWGMRSNLKLQLKIKSLLTVEAERGLDLVGFGYRGGVAVWPWSIRGLCSQMWVVPSVHLLIYVAEWNRVE